MFDSGGGGGDYNDYSSGGGGGSMSGMDLLITLIIIGALAGILWIFQEARLSEERELDATVYINTATDNFETWLPRSGYEINRESFWLEEGSSHRERGNGGDYHCKGGQFNTLPPVRSITFCCSVIRGENPPCLEISP